MQLLGCFWNLTEKLDLDNSRKMSVNMNNLTHLEQLGLTPGANLIKLFTTVIYHRSMLIPSFCVIKLYYIGNYCGIGIAVNYHDKSFMTLARGGKHKYCIVEF
jgi:hypothetical protein